MIMLRGLKYLTYNTAPLANYIKKNNNNKVIIKAKEIN